jgi:hypothetical protein
MASSRVSRMTSCITVKKYNTAIIKTIRRMNRKKTGKIKLGVCRIWALIYQSFPAEKF